jgi:hypothetical protein
MSRRADNGGESSWVTATAKVYLQTPKTGGTPSPSRYRRLASNLLLFCGLGGLPRAKFVQSLVIYEKYDDRVKWTLLEYVSPAGRGVITDWRNDLVSASRKADLDSFLRNMVKNSNWCPPNIKGLHGKHLTGLWELRWRSDNGVPHRIGGYFPDEIGIFVMLIGWTHNKKKYDPPSALETILNRKNFVKTGAATLREYQILTGRTTKG